MNDYPWMSYYLRKPVVLTAMTRSTVVWINLGVKAKPKPNLALVNYWNYFECFHVRKPGKVGV